MSATLAPVLLSLESVSKVFGGGRTRAVRAVDAVSLALRPGETLGLVGETGSGKSTLGRLALRLIQPTSGRIVFEGQDIASLSESRMRGVRSRMQMVFQDPYGSLDPRMNIESLIAEPLIVHGIPRSDRRERVFDAMRRVGLDPAVAHRYSHEFSGGQRQRIGIARALALEPRPIVLDEPVSALDVSIRAQIINLLLDLKDQLGLAYVMISHDLGVVEHLSDRVVIMYLGRIVEQATSAALFAGPRHPYTVGLMESAPKRGVPPSPQKPPPQLMVEVPAFMALDPAYFDLLQAAHGDGTMLSTVVEPVAAFRRLVGRTPPARGWSSHGHHQPGSSIATSPRYGVGQIPDADCHTSDVVAATWFRRLGRRVSGHDWAFRCQQYHRS